MEEKKLAKVYNQTLQGVVSNKRSNRNYTIAFVVCFALMLVLIGFMYVKSLNLVQVVQPNGQTIPARMERKERLMEESLKQAAFETNKYVNTINRYLISEYRARARFYVSAKDLTFIFQTYDKNKYYDRAKEQGYEYKTEFLGSQVDIAQYPYFVRFKSKTTVYDGARVVDAFYVIAEGDVTESTPQFEENTYGWYFSNFKQKYVKQTDTED